MLVTRMARAPSSHSSSISRLVSVWRTIARTADQPGVCSGLTVGPSSPGVMGRSGWTKRSLNPGDHVTVTFSPLRDGGLGGSLRRVQLPDGKILTWSTSYSPPADAKP